ncbi:MAG TPA: MBL fold metallo-hydrolase, partial [Solirubrobacteraceae bacterium]|nr:MBL fold metallo-hydrolase [Solirubrobacteraceae bacterium]
AAMEEPRAIDVHHVGQEKVICCWQVGDALIDPGPASSVETLLEALGDERPARLLLTHIHLDHASAAGALVRRWPDLEVCVHERGAPHMVDPTKLLASAEQLYGEDMERLFGEVAPVPEANLRVLGGGESLEGFEVAYTPGHAWHHVAYRHEGSGYVFTGDVAGVRIPPPGHLLPPTPPPDIDLEAWHRSLDAVAAWAPAALCLTHFGAWTDVADHLEGMHEELDRWGARARDLDADAYAEAVVADMREHGADALDSYLRAMPPDQQQLGLARYWQKRTGRR